MAAPDAAPPEAEPSLADGETNLNFFHGHAEPFDADAGGFTKIRVIPSDSALGPHGKIELHIWTEKNKEVVVKRVDAAYVNVNRGRGPNDRHNFFVGPQRHPEDMLTEIGTYRFLWQEDDVPDFILRMHTVFQRDDKVWMVLDFADGGDLLDTCLEAHRVESEDAISRKVGRWIWQLLRAVSYMHGRGVGHRDISLENVLLSGEDVRLMDFGTAVCTLSAAGEELRFFSEAGKAYYKPCNMYVPRTRGIQMVAPAGCMGGQVISYPGKGLFFCDVTVPHDVVPGQPCTVTPAGYHVRAADVFACGVCAFILNTCLPPWNNTDPWKGQLTDAGFMYVCRSGIVALLEAWVRSKTCRQLAPEALDFLAMAMSMDASQRPTSATLLRHQWF